MREAASRPRNARARGGRLDVGLPGRKPRRWSNDVRGDLRRARGRARKRTVTSGAFAAMRAAWACVVIADIVADVCVRRTSRALVWPRGMWITEKRSPRVPVDPVRNSLAFAAENVSRRNQETLGTKRLRREEDRPRKKTRRVTDCPYEIHVNDNNRAKDGTHPNVVSVSPRHRHRFDVRDRYHVLERSKRLWHSSGGSKRFFDSTSSEGSPSRARATRPAT